MNNKIPYIILTGNSAPRSDENIYKFDCVTAVIKNIDSGLFVALEFSNGEYGLVGGKIEDGESKDEAIIREVEEETGYKNAKIVGVIFEKIYGRGYKARKNREEEGCDKVYYIEVKNEDLYDVNGEEEGIKGIHHISKDELLQKMNLKHHLVFFEKYLEMNK